MIQRKSRIRFAKIAHEQKLHRAFLPVGYFIVYAHYTQFSLSVKPLPCPMGKNLV